MLRTILFSVAGPITFALLAGLFMRARKRELDPSGRPILRYLAAPYLMLACALAFLTVAIYQWLDPVNHSYSGNLMLLSYLPASAGVFTLCYAGYFLTYRATLTSTAIEIYRWPFGHKTYRLKDLERIENRESGATLHFRDNRHFTVYRHYSGGTHFLSTVSANNSLKPNPHQVR